MITYDFFELQDVNSTREASAKIEAATLGEAKEKAEAERTFQGTVLVLAYENGHVVSRRIDGAWWDTDEVSD